MTTDKSKMIGKKPRPRLAVDFDGVIHRYSRGFQDGSIYDEPMPGAKAALARLKKKWWVYIYTTRASNKAGRFAVEAWLQKHDLAFDEVVSHKPIAFAYIDDRAIRFETWNQTIQELTRLDKLRKKE